MMKRLSIFAQNLTGGGRKAAAANNNNNGEETGGWVEKSTIDGVAYYVNVKSHEVSWDKPARMRTATEMEKETGEWTWVPHPTEIWQPARKVETSADGSVKCETQDGETIVIPAGGNYKDKNGTAIKVEFWPLMLSSLKMNEDDLIMLDDINKGFIMYSLRKRYLGNELYTWVGASHSVLVSVNPYKNLPIYGDDEISKHRNRSPNRELAPHVFDIANDSYDSMQFDSVNQSVLISGESGAGKTEATKQCLKFIAKIAGSENNIENKILEANPVLEAFGNAKTIRNNNSSRFGKWIEVYFAPGKRNITSAKIINYLLEKSRLVHQQSGERNFHIFFQMASDNATNDKYSIGALTKHRYLTGGITSSVKGIDDKNDFVAMKKAMIDLGLTQEELDWVLKLTAFVLHLGNCTFKEVIVGSNVRASVLESDDPLNLAKSFLGVETEDLRKVLLNRSITVRSETSVIPLDPAAARAGCDSLAKGVYGRLFDWLVLRINDALVGKEGSFVGILDIFGFEIFENNSFEQLCINFANEKLQQLFNKTTFKEEEALYESEKIKYTHVEFIDNQVVLDLIERKPDGILPMLDDECIVPEGSDAKFMLKIEQAHSGNAKFQTDTKRKLTNTLAFEIFHYAGVVAYDASVFSDKNKDTFFADCYELCGKSSDKYTQALFPKLDIRLQTKSLSTLFRGQLGALMDKLNTTRTRYIRCVKPNDKMEPDNFNTKLALEQLTYSGVFEAVQIRKQGYPFRWTYSAFATRYRCINPNHKYVNKAKEGDAAAARVLCREILDTSPQNFTEIQFGETMVLYHAREHRLLKLLRNLALETIIPRLQRYMRGFLPREMKRRLQRGEKGIQEALDRKNDYPGLKTALEQAEPIIGNLRRLFKDYKARNIAKGEAQLAELKKWVDMEKEIEDMLSKNPNKVYKEFRETLVRADAIKHIPQTPKQIELVDKSKSTLDNCETGRLDAESQKVMALPKTEQKRDILQGFSDSAKKLSFSSPALDQVEEALKEYARIDKEANDSLSEINRERMIQVLKDAAVYGYKVPQEEKIKSILEKFDTVDNDCKQALAVMNREQLEKVLATAREIHHSSDLVQKVEHSIAEFDRVPGEADAALKANNPARLIKVLADARAIKLSTDVIEEIAKVVAQYEKLDADGKTAGVNFDKSELTRIVAEATKLNYASDSVAECKRLLTIPDKEFVESELKIAESQGDNARATHRKIRLLQISLDEGGKAFENFRAFGELRTPDDYASSKMFGKAKLKENFYSFDSSGPIPTSLTKSNDAAFKKQAIALNKSLRAWTGNGKDPKGPEEAAASFISQGSQPDAVRNEMYCQLVKHLTDNSDPESSEKGWTLLGLTLRYVPLSPAIEKYVMMFIRKKSPPYGGKWFSAISECRYGRERAPGGSGIAQAVEAFKKLETGSRFSIHGSASSGPTASASRP